MPLYSSSLTTLPNKGILLKEFKGKKLDELATPAYIIDKSKFAQNACRMLENAAKLKVEFRAHVKTHKTSEGVALQLKTKNFKTDKIVVSTLMEAWNLIPLVQQGLINDILFSLPVVKSRLAELADLATQVPNLRLMLDNAEQLDVLSEFFEQNSNVTKKWSIFIKINMGSDRAGLVNDSIFLRETLTRALTQEKYKKCISVYGFYCHAGHSYGSKTVETAKKILIDEIRHANKAAKTALEIDPSQDPMSFQISVGATPTAHSSSFISVAEIEEKLGEKLSGILELHAGNYPCCDLQQVATGLVNIDDVSVSVLAEIVSFYPNRGDKPPGEQLINAGVLALSRESGPLPGHGRITDPKGYENWIVGRISQEHGILVPLDENIKTEFIPLGTKLRIVPQHSCITAAQYPWYYIVDGSDVVVDIWVPWRGW
ncbi:hypothetical protein PACTADRAFT_47479 [Pachysolen tannophilus NRRL Y-2460]|uniref:D-serine dehydratase n=1 Tax=Pachysolen tannophilus NRRL Y-2460 TaxID=669874 RepID=A0A1E4U0R7_PACTA|nr:hypothetical protein PACTADRAFT_47479 [Pachysolen tannophilus NRRL Y-2460]